MQKEIDKVSFKTHDINLNSNSNSKMKKRYIGKVSMITGCKLSLALLFLLSISMAKATTTLVYNPSELAMAIKKASPGDVILLAKGEWKNANILFEANGTAEKPITISVEQKGLTFLTGNSSLK